MTDWMLGSPHARVRAATGVETYYQRPDGGLLRRRREVPSVLEITVSASGDSRAVQHVA